MTNARYNLEVVVHWPTSVLAVYVWLILGALLVIVPLALAYKAGQSRGHCCARQIRPGGQLRRWMDP